MRHFRLSLPYLCLVDVALPRHRGFFWPFVNHVGLAFLKLETGVYVFLKVVEYGQPSRQAHRRPVSGWLWSTDHNLDVWWPFLRVYRHQPVASGLPQPIPVAPWLPLPYLVPCSFTLPHTPYPTPLTPFALCCLMLPIHWVLPYNPVTGSG